MCCQILFLLVLFAALGFFIGLWISDIYNIKGIPDLWQRLTELLKGKDKLRSWVEGSV